MDQKILDILNQKEEKTWQNSWKLSQELKESHDKIVGALKSLEARNYLNLTKLTEKTFELTAEGLEYSQVGMPEYQIYKYLSECDNKRADKKKVMEKMGKRFKVGLQNGIKKVFLLNKTEMILKDNLGDLQDTLKQHLCQMKDMKFFDGQHAELSKVLDLKALKKRKLFKEKNLVYFQMSKAADFRDKVIVLKADLTMDDIVNNTWKDKQQYKQLNLKAKGKQIENGCLHPLMKMRSQFRNILLEMGFQEMKTNQYVESSFWNFDSLFQPQQHPARDSHDTFFLKNPKSCEILSKDLEDYLQTVKKYHEEGFVEGHEQSFGWKYDWSKEEAQKNILRTHTTSVSARYLKKIAEDFKKNGYLTPVKLFSIDRVFRNETLDSTHLAEFHQVEGLIVGKNLGLAQLKSFIRDFFYKINITEIKFKPAYNPYTEPSMEIFVFHPQLGKMIEIGNSGVFRPEMLRPMGFDEDVSVIAWGLSLERPAMINFKLNNIRELFGHKVDFKMIQNSEIIHFQQILNDFCVFCVQQKTEIAIKKMFQCKESRRFEV